MFPWLLLVLSVCARPGTGLPPRHMDSLVQILDALESPARGGSPGSVPALARALGVCSTPGCRAVLGEPPEPTPAPAALPPEQWQLLRELLRPEPAAPERGAVLAPDGSTVALGPLLAGLEVGLRLGGGSEGPRDPLPTLRPPLDPLLAVTVAEVLGTSFLLARGGDGAALGPGGCWDDVDDPQNYTLAGPPTLVPDAVANGAMDGVVLGARLAREPAPLSELLRGYYGTGNGSERGRPPSSYRRRDFGALAGPGKLEEELVAMLELLRVLPPTRGLLEGVGPGEVATVARRAAGEFTRRYVECPAIVPRCMWGARPYRGTPSPLTLPLGSVFIHHTLEPGTPCRSFRACARAMRSMQRFHQDTRAWDDIGYSFVVGSDGYLYEGRGWHWVGAHTKGYNTRGFGVGYVGDFSATLPDPDTLALVRDELLPCAVRAGRILQNYTLHGHRQLGRTDCPGNALFQEIQGWPGFQ
ncbi:N-acetylmuramoyl-L-alanine amidase [Corapipo altera]|uniref:N-acetylmuramoyl-L-alanine amidase n=1 Tax=Corapipo altera TaxID=415028 RepID=UPI000FD64E49|nr:N-acetylmuramoyl-L-alanine amidase [Corapipo altera]